MRRAALLLLAVALPLAVAELWAAFRPDDLTDEIQEWFETARGRFEIWLAETNRGD